MAEDSEIIVCGPAFSGTEYWGSVAQFLVPKMMSHPKDFVLQVDCETNESITCHEFLRQSLSVAEGLINFGIAEGDVVAILGPNNIRSHVAAFGILFSGGVIAPLDEGLKSFEFRNLLKQFHPKYIMCTSAKREEIFENLKSIKLNPKIIVMDSPEDDREFFGWKEIQSEVDVDSYTPRTVKQPKESTAIICCSSGSTGTPKGAAISHYTVLHNLALTESLFVPAKNENFILSSPLYWISGFILSVNSCYFGQTRYVPRSNAPEDLLQAVEKCKPFFLLLPPSLLLPMVDHPNFQKYDVSSIKIIFSAGGTLGEKMLSKIKKVLNDIPVSNVYGLTEAYGGITLPPGSDSTNAMGKLLPGFSVKVVDVETGKSLGPCKTGECRIKSKRLMNGYYNNEKDTKAAFDEGGWLRTGDLVYYDEEGVFYFAGRIKEVIQYLNHQISPTELETFLMCLPGVKDVAVVPIPHETDDNHVRALVVKHPNFEVSAQYIIQAVKENFVPHKQLTGGVQFVDELPRTAVGKLKRLEAQRLLDRNHLKET